MEPRKLIWLLMFVGGTVGGYIPMLWGAGVFSFSSIILSAIGGIMGIYIGFKISR
jgi:hypothetical protein